MKTKPKAGFNNNFAAVRKMAHWPTRKMALTVLFDRALACLPTGIWAAAPLFLGGLALGLIVRLSPISAAAALVVFLYAYRRNRAGHEEAVAEGRAAPSARLRRDWQRRYFHLRSLVRELSSQMGVPAPRIVIEGSHIEMNMRVFASGAGSVLLVNEAMLRENLSPALDETGLRGIVAHEIAHLRPGQDHANQLSAAIRALRASLLAASVAGCGLAGAPIALLGVSVATMALISLGGQAAHRREEIEANLVAARLLGSDGPRTVLTGFAQASLAAHSLAYAIRPGRAHGLSLRASLLEVTGFGAASLQTSLESWPHEESFEPDPSPTVRDRAARFAHRLARPFSDHPGLASLAVLLGVERL